MLTFAALALSLLAAMLGAGLGLFFWRHLTEMEEQVETLTKALETDKDTFTTLEQRLQVVDEQRRDLKASIRNLTTALEQLTETQAQQSHEIKRLFQREHAPLRFGVEPRAPVVLPSSTPAYKAPLKSPTYPTTQ